MKHVLVEHGDPDERGWRRYRCVNCSLKLHPTPFGVDKIHAGECQKRGLGDYASAFLSMFGITKKRANVVAKACGIKRGCGCNERQDAVNTVGWRAWSWLKAKFRRAEAAG